ncbi:MAG: alpha/beta fold hydrolase, partial [Bacteroidetes bacterium]|nr:alpha/beta fold hydrolase [Bacteroidota bacterium]
MVTINLLLKKEEQPWCLCIYIQRLHGGVLILATDHPGKVTMEEKVFFNVENFQLEGLLKKGNGGYGIIVFHPHPLYGGDMLSPVVESISLVLQRRGLTTLRFNFRGSGKSGGSYDNGIGEQRDALAAIEFLQNQGISKICLVGYSFGAWVLALVSQYPKIVTSIIYVAPPVALLDF